MFVDFFYVNWRQLLLHSLTVSTAVRLLQFMFIAFIFDFIFLTEPPPSVGRQPPCSPRCLSVGNRGPSCRKPWFRRPDHGDHLASVNLSRHHSRDFATPIFRIACDARSTCLRLIVPRDSKWCMYCWVFRGLRLHLVVRGYE